MSSQHTSIRGDVMVVNATLIGHSKVDFDKRQIKKVLRREGRKVQREARRLVARKAISSAGQAPGLDTGTLRKSIDLRFGGGGFWVKVEPITKTIIDSFGGRRGAIYYPAILFYGSDKRGIEPRSNYMTDALEKRASPARAAIKAALQSSLVPR